MVIPEILQRPALWLIAAYFAVLVGALLGRRKTLSHPWLFLLRSFFPNWRFYQALGSAPRLYVRSQDDQGN
jgi:hypothetical protein